MNKPFSFVVFQVKTSDESVFSFMFRSSFNRDVKSVFIILLFDFGALARIGVRFMHVP